MTNPTPRTAAGQTLLHDLNFDPHQRQRLKSSILDIEAELDGELRDALEAAVTYLSTFVSWEQAKIDGFDITAWCEVVESRLASEQPANREET